LEKITPKKLLVASLKKYSPESSMIQPAKFTVCYAITNQIVQGKKTKYFFKDRRFALK